jgi:hypothetical protein
MFFIAIYVTCNSKVTLYRTSLQIARRGGAESSKQTSSIDTLLPCCIQDFIDYHYTATYESQSICLLQKL